MPKFTIRVKIYKNDGHTINVEKLRNENIKVVYVFKKFSQFLLNGLVIFDCLAVLKKNFFK